MAINTMVITQVSATIIKTKLESKTNQASLRPFRFLLKDFQRTNHSNAKYMQKKCSEIWNTGCACSSISAVLLSVSMEIHEAFKAMTASVSCSKRGCLAIWGKTPNSQ